MSNTLERTSNDGSGNSSERAAVVRGSESTGEGAGKGNVDLADPETVVDEESLADRAVDIDQIFEILKNGRRRAVLRYLRTADGEVRLGELSEQIAAWECDKDVSRITSSERKRVYVGLYQSHLPKMDDVSAISYNKPRGKIGPGENMALFEHYLPTEGDGQERDWTIYHLVLTAVAVTLTLSLVLVALLL